VAFPVGLNLRHIINPVRSGETCEAVILPRRKSPDLLVFDIFIMGLRDDSARNRKADGFENREFKEIITGLKMRDVSSGRMAPPDWVAE
jgi:hypothetical protein